MKRSEIIRKALNHLNNTVCVNPDQVDVMLSVFEDLGMLPPLRPAHPMDSCWDRAICAEMDGMDVKVALWEREVEEKKPAKKKGSAKTSRSGLKRANQ
jgi:hypothetical protein